MSTRVILLIAGPLVVACYAMVMVLIAAVWDPSAAVPWMSYPQIVDTLTAFGMNVPAAYVVAVVWAGIGVAMGVFISVVGAKRRLTTRQIMMWHLAVVAAGAPATFIAAFPWGMNVADAFGVSGGAHTPWSGVLYAVSAASLIVLAASAGAQRFRSEKEPAPVSA